MTAVTTIFGVLSLVTASLLDFLLTGAGAYSLALYALGVVLLAISAVVEFRRLRLAASSPRGRLRMNIAVKSSLLVGIVVMSSAIAARLDLSLDTVAGARFALSEPTVTALDELDAPVEAVMVFPARAPDGLVSYVDTVLAEYARSSEHIAVRRVDPDRNPDLARRYDVTRAEAVAGSVVFIGAAGRASVPPQLIAEGAEEAFTGAILEASGVRRKTVHFVGGQGPASVQSRFQRATEALRSRLFEVGELSLEDDAPIPDDANLLIMRPASWPPSTQALGVALDFARSGGRLMVLLDPDPPEAVIAAMAELDIDIGAGTVRDPRSRAAGEPTDLVVTEDRNAWRLSDLHFPGATSVGRGAAMPPAVRTVPLAWTTAEGRVDGGQEGGDDAPPTLALMLEGIPADVPGGLVRGRVIVFGDSDFAADSAFDDGENGTLFLAAVESLLADVDLVDTGAAPRPNRRLVLSAAEARFLNVSSSVLLPGLVLLAGLFVWLRRRA